MSLPAEVATALAWYVYGVVDPPPSRPAAGVEGDVAVLREGELSALVSRVPLSEYGEEPVRAKLEDPAWLEEKARAHEAVLHGALGAGAVLPFRFLTLYQDEDELRDFLRSRQTDLRAALERVRGKVELGVKAFVDSERRAPASDELRALDEELETAAAGKAYLLRRKRDRLAEEHGNRFKLECARDCHARLSAVAEAAVSNPPQPLELSGRPDEMVLNGAYLVSADDLKLPAVLAELQEKYHPFGVSLELTGPWPAYNFVPRGFDG